MPKYSSTFILRALPDDRLVLLTPSRIPETLPAEVLTKMHAPPKPDYPIISPSDLTKFDAFLFGIPTRYGNFPAQWKVSSVAFHHISAVWWWIAT